MAINTIRCDIIETEFNVDWKAVGSA